MAETTITIRVDPELKTAFSRAAQARERTDQDLLREFMRDFIETQRTDSEYEEWFRRQVQIVPRLEPAPWTCSRYTRVDGISQWLALPTCYAAPLAILRTARFAGCILLDSENCLGATASHSTA